MNQRRKHSPAVYRRRRLVAALLAVFVLALAVWGARGIIDYFSSQDEPASAGTQEQTTDDDGGADATGEAEPSDAETDEPAPTQTEQSASADPDEAETDEAETDGEQSPQPEGSCAPGDVAVRASTHQDSYDAGVAPLLSMEIENTGSQECTLDVGTAEQVFIVSHSGSEVFNTAQCGTDGDSLEMTFEPGQTERAQLTWPRSDSSTDCTEPAELVSGDYELTVSVSGITSDPHTFEIAGVEE